MSERNYEMKTVCAICSTPFDAKEEGYEGDINKVPSKICGGCYEGFVAVVDETIPDVMIECPKCKCEIGVKVETLDDP